MQAGGGKGADAKAAAAPCAETAVASYLGLGLGPIIVRFEFEARGSKWLQEGEPLHQVPVLGGAYEVRHPVFSNLKFLPSVFLSCMYSSKFLQWPAECTKHQQKMKGGRLKAWAEAGV